MLERAIAIAITMVLITDATAEKNASVVFGSRLYVNETKKIPVINKVVINCNFNRICCFCKTTKVAPDGP